MRNFNFLASLCSYGDGFESHFVGNPEDRFSRDIAHFIQSTEDDDLSSCFYFLKLLCIIK